MQTTNQGDCVDVRDGLLCILIGRSEDILELLRVDWQLLERIACNQDVTDVRVDDIVAVARLERLDNCFLGQLLKLCKIIG